MIQRFPFTLTMLIIGAFQAIIQLLIADSLEEAGVRVLTLALLCLMVGLAIDLISGIRHKRR